MSYLSYPSSLDGPNNWCRVQELNSERYIQVFTAVTIQVDVFGVVTQFSPWRWRQHRAPRRWYPTATLHGVTPQKTSTWNKQQVEKRWRGGVWNSFFSAWNSEMVLDRSEMKSVTCSFPILRHLYQPDIDRMRGFPQLSQNGQRLIWQHPQHHHNQSSPKQNALNSLYGKGINEGWMTANTSSPSSPTATVTIHVHFLLARTDSASSYTPCLFMPHFSRADHGHYMTDPSTRQGGRPKTEPKSLLCSKDMAMSPGSRGWKPRWTDGRTDWLAGWLAGWLTDWLTFVKWLWLSRSWRVYGQQTMNRTGYAETWATISPIRWCSTVSTPIPVWSLFTSDRR
jgi:hypothetical protein